ncbi:MAG: hypothetical protein E3K32_07510 [wastewater metagenome]|nr:hypothetical protein [Candidatus Loosdrechtia aerotolerans]
MTDDNEIVVILEKRERKRFFYQIQRESEEKGLIPPAPFLFLKTMVRPLQYTGGILLGVFLGIFSLIFVFLLFVYLLHLEL